MCLLGFAIALFLFVPDSINDNADVCGLSIRGRSIRVSAAGLLNLTGCPTERWRQSWLFPVQKGRLNLPAFRVFVLSGTGLRLRFPCCLSSGLPSISSFFSVHICLQVCRQFFFLPGTCLSSGLPSVSSSFSVYVCLQPCCQLLLPSRYMSVFNPAVNFFFLLGTCLSSGRPSTASLFSVLVCLQVCRQLPLFSVLVCLQAKMNGDWITVLRCRAEVLGLVYLQPCSHRPGETLCGWQDLKIHLN